MLDLPTAFTCYRFAPYPNLMLEGVTSLIAQDVETAISMLKLDFVQFQSDARVALLLWRDAYGKHEEALIFGDGRRLRGDKPKARWGMKR